MIELRTLGTIELRNGDGRSFESVLAQPKRFALLFYLATAGPVGAFHRRDKLLAMFWPELDGERARAALRNALYFLRQSLGANVIRRRGDEEIGVNPDELECDVVRFEATGSLNDYRGELLPGFHVGDAADFENWLESRRMKLARAAADAAWCAVDANDPTRDEVVRRAERAAELSELGESTLRKLLLAYESAGDAAGAVRVFESYRERMKHELDIEPSPDTLALLARITKPARVRTNYNQPHRRRLIVLPFRILRPDPETDFLAYSLPDAITTSLSGFHSLIVRSMAAAANVDPNDLEDVSRKTGVDLVLTGTLVRVGDELRVSTQLVELPDKDLIASVTAELPLGDLFAVQEAITRSVISSLELPLTHTEWQLLERDVPRSASAYELYLRANEAAQRVNQWEPAIEMYLRCVREDPKFAPAWAHLGRCYRLIAKYTTPPDQIETTLRLAEEAFQRALSLNSELPLAHSLYAQLDIDRGRARDAMQRLLDRLAKTGKEPDLYVGLVQACRFAGLLDESLAAHTLARAIDPGAVTSVTHTYFMMGDYERAIAEYRDTDIGYMRSLALVHAGRLQEAIEALRERERVASGRVRSYVAALRALITGDESAAYALTLEVLNVQNESRLEDLAIDPESAFYIACHLAKLRKNDFALKVLWYVVRNGYNCGRMLQRDPWLQPLRRESEFARIQDYCASELLAAQRAFQQADGPALLEMTSGSSRTHGRS